MYKNGALNKTKTNIAILREQQNNLITATTTVTIQFSGCLLTLKFNSASAYCQAGIKTQMQHKKITNT
jgi:hypothetical protein